MDLKIFALYFISWTSISLNAGDRDGILDNKNLGETFFQQDSCYKVSFRDICSQESIQEKSQSTDILLRNETKVLRYDETASCPGWCLGKTYTSNAGEFTTYKYGNCCWKCQDECKRLDLREFPSLECHTIDALENVWMVNMCSSNWPLDEVRKRCQNNFPDFLSRLPVLAKSGLSYKNVFCAHCNNDRNFDIWPLYVECQGRVPYEILQDDVRTILTYIRKYCEVRIASTLDILQMARKIPKGNGTRSSAKNTINDLLEDFSSRLKRCLLRQNVRHGLAKFMLSSVRESFTSYFDCNEVLRVDNFKNITRFDSVSLGMDGNKFVYWNMPMSFGMNDVMTIKRRDKRWTPPSFSMLFQFHEPDNMIVYSEEGSSVNSISPSNSCDAGEVYDPFYRSCRPVMCTTNQAFTGVSCADTVPEASKNGRSVESVSGTVTLVVEFPSQYITSRINTSIDLDAMSKCITAALAAMPVLRGAVFDNITLASVTLENHNHHPLPEACDEENTAYSLSFRLENKQERLIGDEEIIQMANNLSSWIAFQRVEWKSDHVSIFVLNSYLLINKLPTLCETHENEETLLYFDNEYDVVDHEGQLWVHVPERYKYYPEYDYQFLDWIVSVTENGTERTFIDNSRVVVCDNEALNVSSCHVFIPLNQTEYDILPNGDVYLTDRNATVPRNETAVIEGSLAICIDEYLLLENNRSSSDQDGVDEKIYYLWIEIAIWINFCLSMLSLISLVITFVTYVIFQDLRTISGCCIMNLIVAQFCSMTLYLFVAGADLYDDACAAIAVMLHYLFLSAFFWNNAISFDVWRTFGFGLKSAVHRMAQNRRNSTVGFTASYGKKTIYIYMLYAWGTPGILVFVTFVLDMWADSIDVGYQYDPGIGICWISNATANVIAFGIPVFIILLANIVFFCLTIYSIRKCEKRPARKSRKPQMLPSVSDEVDGSAESNNSKTDNSGSEHGTTSKCNGHERDRRTRIRIFYNRKNIRKSSMPVHRTSSSRARANVFTYLKMSVLMGMSWLIGFVAVFAKVLVIWFIFELFISLNGIFIFLTFVWKKRIRERYRYVFSSSCCSCVHCNEN